MAIRDLIFNISGFSEPEDFQHHWGGMQYEDNATEVVFNVSQDLFKDFDSLSFRIDLNSELAGYSAGISKSFSSPSEDIEIRRSIPFGFTKYGGNIEATLVCSLNDAEDSATLLTFPVTVNFTPVERDEEGYLEDYKDISEAELSARLSMEQAELSACTAKSASDICLEAKETTEKARFALENGAEFVFEGGNAEAKATVDFVVDKVLSEESENPIANDAVARKFGEYYSSDLIDEKIKEVLLLAHPIGSYYWSSEPTNPAALFGGVWEQIKDTFVLAAGDKYSAGQTGGEAEHTLTANEMPKHKHIGLTWAGNSNMPVGFSVDGTVVDSGYNLTWSQPLSSGNDFHTNETGGGQPHNNMPPYIVAYCYKRTA